MAKSLTYYITGHARPALYGVQNSSRSLVDYRSPWPGRQGFNGNSSVQDSGDANYNVALFLGLQSIFRGDFNSS